MPRSRLQHVSAALPLAIAALLAAHPSFAATPTTYIGPDLGLWTDPLNWSAGVPTSSAFDAIISTALPVTVQLNASETINSLTVLSPNTLSIVNGTTLTIAGTSLTNSGSLTISGKLFFTNNATLSGMGNILLNGGTLIALGLNQLTNDNVISGAGVIAVNKIVNLSTISATTGLLFLSAANASDSFINAGTLLADGGTLGFSSVPIDNTAGLIRANANSQVTLPNVNGGSIVAADGGTVILAGNVSNAQLSGAGLVGLTTTFSGVNVNQGTITVNQLMALAGGTLVNSGFIKLSTFTGITLHATTLLAGSGTLVLNDGGIDGPMNSVFNNASNIVGRGQITGRLVNTGTIAATTGLLTLFTASTNNGVMAVSGGHLAFNAPVTNAGGTITASAGTLTSGGTITGGLIQFGSGGLISMPFGSVNGATINVLPGGSVSLGSPSLSNVILNNSGNLSTAASLSLIGNATISGAGTMTMTNAIISASGGTRTLSLGSLLTGSGSLGTGGPLKVINNGTIVAKAGILIIQPNNSTDGFLNAGILRADGGTLSLQNSTFQNANGIIEAVNNSIVGIGAQALTTIKGGTLRTQSGGTISIGSALLADVTFAGTILFGQGVNLQGTSNIASPLTFNPGIPSAFSITGTVNNPSIITIGNSGTMVVNDNIALTGGGTLHLNGFFANSGSPHTVYNDNLIDGSGAITLTQLVNTGTIVANNGTKSLTMNIGTLTNSGRLQAASGTLVLGASSKILTGGGIIEVLPGSTLLFNSMNATGGTFQLQNDGIMRLTSSVLSNINVQSSGGTLTATSASTFTGSLTNTGNLVVAGGTTYHVNFAANITNSGNMTFLTAPSNVVSGSTTLGSALQNSGTLRILPPSTINTNATAFLNTGTIILDAATLNVYQNFSLLGGGTLIMNSSSSTIAQSFSGQLPAAAVLTIGNTITGQGQIGLLSTSPMKIVNNGTIIASTGILYVAGRSSNPGNIVADPFVNNGLLLADGGTLNLQRPSGSLPSGVTNTNGIIKAVHGSTVIVDSAFGGLITAEDTAKIKIIGSVSAANLFQPGPDSRIVFANLIFNSAPTLRDVSLNGYSSTEPGITLMLIGTVSHTGTLSLVSSSGIATAAFSPTQINTSLVGGGTILMQNSSASLFAYNTQPANGIFRSDNTIMGGGKFSSPYSSGSFINDGLIEATGSFGFTFNAANVAGNVVNNGTLRANGGPITLNGSANTTYLNNGLIQAMPGNAVFINSPVIGGTLSSLGLIQLAATTKVNELQINSDTQSLFTATLDVKNSKFILQTLSTDKMSKLAFLQSALLSGFNNGEWLGMGITSSTVAADQSATGTHMTALALYDNANLHLTTFGGEPVDTSSLLITTALIGDTNFDNAVNQSDFDTIINHWQSAQHDWTTGDLNYDGTVDLLDAVLVTTHWQQTFNPSTGLVSAAALFPPTLPSLTVPEPSVLALFLGAMILLPRRQHRNANIR